MEKLNTKLLRRLSTFRKSKKLKKAFLMYMVANLPSHNLAEERKEFVKLDKDNDGYISTMELEDALKGLKDSH
jgi:Ca2+-binding EF-hand superfamily protein